MLKCSGPRQTRYLHVAEQNRSFAVSFQCAVLLSLPGMNVCFFSPNIFRIKQLAVELKCTLWVNVKSNGRVSAHKVALKRAEKNVGIQEYRGRKSSM